MASCASSQNTAGAEAKNRVKEWRSLLKLSSEQAKRAEAIEAGYIDKNKKLQLSGSLTETQLAKLKEKRKAAFKKVLSAEQFAKWLAIEKGAINNAVIRLERP